MFEIRKIGIVRRASALLLDAILLAVLATGFMYLISLMCNYSGQDAKVRSYYTQWDDYRIEYMADIADSIDGFEYVEAEDGNHKILKDGLESSPDVLISALINSICEKHEELGFAYHQNGSNYSILKDGKPSSLGELIDTLLEDVDEPDRMDEALIAYGNLPSISTINNQERYNRTLLFLMITFGILLSYAVLEFILPIVFKNGQTVGKKVFSIGLVRPNCVKITILSLFTRTFVGKYAIETMFPLLLVFMFFFTGNKILAIILFAALTLFNVIVFFVTKNRTPIHDILSGCVAADMRVQMVYDTEEEMIEQKKAKHKEYIESSNY